jgi:hypothetical protein
VRKKYGIMSITFGRNAGVDALMHFGAHGFGI